MAPTSPTHHLHIETHGPQDGPPVVLLHHGLGSTRAWRGQVPAFTRAGFRVIVYDRWGYGQSHERPALAVPGFEDDLADLQRLLNTLPGASYSLVGHSDGGTIALYYALQHPGQVAALVTVAAHIYLEEKMEPGIQQILTAFENDSRFRQGLQNAHGSKYEAAFYNWFNGWHTPAALSWDMRPQLKQITCPSLVIQGLADEHATPGHARDIAAGIPGADLWLVPGANHMFPQNDPAQFNPRVVDFLTQNHS